MHGTPHRRGRGVSPTFKGGQRTMADTNVNFEVEIHVAERAERLYAATIMPFHVTGYSDTFDG